MKKIFLFFALGLVSTIYLSCSDESDSLSESTNDVKLASRETSSLSTTEVKDAQKLYLAMISTAEYKSFGVLIDSFNEKLNGNKVSFSTKTEWVDWINGNISKTRFSSVSQFNSMYDNLAVKLSGLTTNNAHLFYLLNRANEVEFIKISTYPRFNYQTTGSVSCIVNCMNIHSAAIDAARATYESRMRLARMFTSVPSLSPAGGVGVWVIERDYNNTEARLALEYNACVGGCR